MGVYFRHYSIGRKTAGLQRGVSKLLRKTRVPKLGRCEDISDFVLGGGIGASESEMEDVEEVPIAGAAGRTAIKLVETGPRLKLTLVKVEEGVMGGAVIYHRFSSRTPSQIEVHAEAARKKRKFKERNEKLSALAKGLKATKKEREKKKAERYAAMGKKQDAEAPADSDAEDAGSNKRHRVASREADDDAEEPAAGAKKKKFHPF